MNWIKKIFKGNKSSDSNRKTEENKIEFHILEKTTPTFEYTVDNGFITITDYRGGGTKGYYTWFENGKYVYSNNVWMFDVPDMINGHKVIHIGKKAFEDTGCIRITLPEGIKSIGFRAFYSNKNLQEIVIPASVIEIEDQIFWDCESLANVIIKGKIPCISHGMFFYCKNLETITLPDSIQYIGSQAFSSCQKLHSISIPDGVTKIGWQAFHDCWSLERIFIPKSVTEIQDKAFSNNYMTEFIVDNLNPAYCTVDGVLFDKSLTTLIKFPGTKSGEYVIPESVSILEDSAFDGAKNLTKITISDKINHITEKQFNGCNEIRDIIVGINVKNFKANDFGWKEREIRFFFKGDAPKIDEWYFNTHFYGKNSSVFYISGTKGWDKTLPNKIKKEWKL